MALLSEIIEKIEKEREEKRLKKELEEKELYEKYKIFSDYIIEQDKFYNYGLFYPIISGSRIYSDVFSQGYWNDNGNWNDNLNWLD